MKCPRTVKQDQELLATRTKSSENGIQMNGVNGSHKTDSSKSLTLNPLMREDGEAGPSSEAPKIVVLQRESLDDEPSLMHRCALIICRLALHPQPPLALPIGCWICLPISTACCTRIHTEERCNLPWGFQGSPVDASSHDAANGPKGLNKDSWLFWSCPSRVKLVSSSHLTHGCPSCRQAMSDDPFWDDAEDSGGQAQVLAPSRSGNEPGSGGGS